MKIDTFESVGTFHEKFDLPIASRTPPAFPPEDVLRFRGAFLLEETAEFFEACGMPQIAQTIKNIGKAIQTSEGSLVIAPQDLDKAADALGDLKYVTDGTAHMMGIPFNEVFTEIQRANMAKERATGADDPRNTRPHALNVVKPAGWTPPDHTKALDVHRNFMEQLQRATDA
jgi:predicted HAD superfamily Cof-like phosphohydrolase